MDINKMMLSASGVVRFKTDIFVEGDLSEKLQNIIGLCWTIGNELCYIITKDAIDYESLYDDVKDQPHLLNINEFGLAFSKDLDHYHGEQFTSREYFRTMLVPWSQIITIAAKLTT